MPKDKLFDEISAILTGSGFEGTNEAMSRIREAMEKAVSDGFVRKELYKEKLSELENLKEAHSTAISERDTALNGAREYREKYEGEAAAFEAYTQSQKEAVLRSKTEKAAQRQLEADGANPLFIRILLKELNLCDADLSEEENDSVCINNWEELSKPVKSTFPEVFGEAAWRGASSAKPPQARVSEANPWQAESKDLDAQTRLYRENPDLARRLAEDAGIKL